MTSRRTLLRAGAGAFAASTLAAGTAHGDTRTPWDRLRQRLRGRLVRPGDPRYPTAKLLDLQQFDVIDPRAIAYCADARDIALCLSFVQDYALPFAVRSGGHSFGGYSTSEGLVIDVSALAAVVPEQPGTVRIGAGTQAVDVVDVLAPLGLGVSVGEHATVGAGGFLAGGGIGFFSRTLGLACDPMVSARVVLADGRLVTASAEEHPDLYWALRGGGGGNFGVVTSYVVRPAPISTVNTAFLEYDYATAVDFADGYTRWLVDAPREIGAAAILVLGDSAPGNIPFVAGYLMSTGSASQLQREAARLTELTGPPVSQSFEATDYRDFAMTNFGCAALTVAQCHRVDSSPGGTLPRDGFGLVRGRMIATPPPRAGWERALAVFDTVRVPGEVHKLELLALGGAVADLGPTDTAYAHRGSLLDVNYLSFDYTGPPSAVRPRWVDAGFEAIDPYSTGGTYVNFIDPSLPDWRRSYYGANYARLTKVKSQYDPFGTFRFAQGVGRATS